MCSSDLNPVIVSNITAATATASGSNISIRYSYSDVSGKTLNPGDVVTIKGFSNSAFNISNGLVSSADGSSFVISSKYSHAPSAIISYSSPAQLYAAAAPTPLTGSAGSASASATAEREPNISERRLAAAALVSATMSVSSTYPSTPSAPSDASDFMNSSGTWAGTETGLNNVDLWIGGLAENPAKQPVTPPMLGKIGRAHV